MTIDPKKSGASPSAPTWGTWSGNIVHEPPTNGANYYFRPTNLVELKSVLADAVTKGVTVRVSALGLRHAHPRIFEEITWNTDRVYEETIERSKEINLPVVTLPAWYDVDDRFWLNRLLSELLPEWAKEVVPQGAPAPNTKEFLRQVLVQEGTTRIWYRR
jgi:hypothetical protein